METVTLTHLIHTRRAEIEATARKHGASNVRVFGSVARGSSHADSDLDLLVDFESGRTLLDHATLQIDLESLLGCRVDVVTERGLRATIRDEVMREAIPL